MPSQDKELCLWLQQCSHSQRTQGYEQGALLIPNYVAHSCFNLSLNIAIATNHTCFFFLTTGCVYGLHAFSHLREPRQDGHTVRRHLLVSE
jgi:hypothetical protein